VTLEVLRGNEKLTKQVAVLERPRDSEQILSMVDEENNLVAKLGVLALDLDGRTTPLLPTAAASFGRCDCGCGRGPVRECRLPISG